MWCLQQHLEDELPIKSLTGSKVVIYHVKSPWPLHQLQQNRRARNSISDSFRYTFFTNEFFILNIS